MRALLLPVGLLFALTSAVAAQAGRGPAPVPLHLRAAIVGEDLTVKAIPQARFLLIGPAGDTSMVETDLDGRAEASLKPGEYKLQSAAAVRLAGASYQWALAVQVAAGMRPVELTQKNALVEAAAEKAAPPSAQAPSSARRVSEEAQVFERVKSGVFTVNGAGGKGSGFLVDSAGIVLTNAHVVADVEPDRVRVMTDAKTQVYGRTLFLDRDHDVAAIAIDPGACKGCAVLPLVPEGTEPLAVAGERVLAIGSPLNQTGVLTVGIVSKVEARAIISDVNINHGNSGGPMLNLDGQVIAINAFGDFTSQGGPGISGSIAITQARAALAAARDSMARPGFALPPATPLPVLSPVPYPIEGVKAAAAMEKIDLKPYSASGGPFDITVMTPPIMAWRQAAGVRALGERRKKREKNANVTENEKVDNIQVWTAWDEYVGERKPGVVLQVVPRVGETGGSIFGNVLGALAAGPYYVGHHTYAFKGDFRRMRLYRDDRPVEAVEEGRAPAVLNFQDYFNSGKDLAYQGLSVYAPEVFEPRPDGTWPTIVLSIENTGKKDPVRVVLDERTLRAIHSDFDAHRRLASQPACAADPNGTACAQALEATAARYLAPKGAGLYEGPSKWTNPAGELPKGAEVLVLRNDGKWAFIKYGTLSGYVQADKIAPKP